MSLITDTLSDLFSVSNQIILKSHLSNIADHDIYQRLDKAQISGGANTQKSPKTLDFQAW